MRYLSGTDTQMLYADTAHAQNLIAPLSIFDPSSAPGGDVSFEEILSFVERRLHISGAFRERLVRVPLGLDRPVWINDPEFDIEYHVREMALPAPGDWTQLCTQIARLGARPLDMTRPPWELYIIRGIDAVDGFSPGSFATMLKLHHAAVDGVAGAELVTALFQATPDAEPTLPEKTWRPDSMPSPWGMLVRAGMQTFTRPIAARRAILRSIGVTPRTIRNSIRPPAGAPRSSIGMATGTRFNRPVSAHRVWGAVRFDLGDIKELKNAAAPGSSINDVALTIVGGALRRYLLDKAELPASSLTAIMPISVRPTSTQLQKSGKAGPTASAGGGGNRFAMSVVPLGTDIEDPRERLHSVRAHTAAAKEFGVDAMSLVEATELLPGALLGTVQRTVARVISSTGRAVGAQTIVTNVPGPRSPMYFCGATGLYMSGMAPIVDGMGLINGIGSYVDDFSVCFTADRDMMPDPELYEQCIQDEYDALRKALVVRSGLTRVELDEQRVHLGT